jgi:hypothetical protein
MRRSGWLILAVVVNVFLSTLSLAQTNSCISTTDGFWDEARIWSLGRPPSIKQSAILITNDASETVTIDGTTAAEFKSTMTISNLNLSAPAGSSDTLYLDNTGTIALHILNGLAIGMNLSTFPSGGSVLISSNSSLTIDGVVGGQLQDDGTIVIAGGSLVTTNCSIQLGDPIGLFANVSVLSISNAIVQARDVSVSPGESSSGTIEIFGGKMTLTSTLDVGDGIDFSQGSFLVANGGLLVVTNSETFMGGIESSGTMTVSNATFLGADVYLGGTRSGSELFINNGTVSLSGQLDIGYGDAGGGNVLLNGGMLAITNTSTIIGGDQCNGEMTIEDGVFLAREVLVGSEYDSEATLSILGGTSVLSSNLQVGSMVSLAAVSMVDGQLFVTNAPIAISGGFGEVDAQFDVSGGHLAAKTIVLGNFAEGAFTVDGGSVTVSEGITLGDCNDDFAIGYVTVDGGKLVVTNATSTGFIDVRNGQLVLSGGRLHVDKLVMMNSCGSFIHTGGKLIVGSVVLDPNAFQITSIAREGDDLRVTWMMGPGQTNALQVSSGGKHGAYSGKGFADIFVVTNNTTAGTLTNYLDVGAATNKPSRYYRARLAP